MSDIREIVTKAIVSKGKKEFTLNEVITLQEDIYSVLGCFVIKHDFTAVIKDDVVVVSGDFEVNVWYSKEANNKTDILRSIISYHKEIKTKQIVNQYLKGSEYVLASSLKHPKVIEANIGSNCLELEINLEILAEIIGETKMQVNILKDNSINISDFDDLDIEINEDFIKNEQI